jgi:hypothetical protein
MSKVNIPICKLSDEECNTLFNSVVDKLNIHNPKFFYPIYKKVIDEDTTLSEDLKKIVLDSKFKCKEILEKLYDEDEEEFETESENDETINNNSEGEQSSDDNDNETKDNETKPNGTESNDNLDDVLNQDADLPLEEDVDSGDEFNDEDIDDAINNTFLANAKIERTNKATGEKTITEETIHIKKTALLDPLRVMKDEYIIPSKIQNKDIDDESIKNTNSKLDSYNNSGHVESFFLYLASKLVESGKCPSFPYYYGCINGEDPNYHHNITDEYESVSRTKWFKNRVKNDFDLLIIENDDVEEFQQQMLSNIAKQNRLDGDGNDVVDASSEEDGEVSESGSDEENVSDNLEKDLDETDSQEISSGEEGDTNVQVTENENLPLESQTLESQILDVDNIDDALEESKPNLDFIKSMDDEDLEIEDEELMDAITKVSELNGESNTDAIEELDIEELSDIDDGELSFGDFENNESNLYFLRCQDMPVSLSLMEKLDNTLDNILDDDYNMSETEWFGVFFQVAFGLAIAQKYFNFVHNDLHSSNIMFKSTNNKSLYFQIGNVYYRIPTFGKITKIIDFARGTFKFADRWVFSDQFKDDGDAFGQYDYPVDGTLKNCDTKPNPSFDLVRLGTTVIQRLEDLPAVREFVEDITIDDNGSSLCYDDDTFQLYVDIAHNCHNAVPIEVLAKPVFDRFKIHKNKIPRGSYIFKY